MQNQNRGTHEDRTYASGSRQAHPASNPAQSSGNPRRQPQNADRQSTPSGQKMSAPPRTTPEGYRAAGPYTVPPRQNRERLPYPTREAVRRRRQKERRKKRLIRVGLLVLAALILFLMLFFASRFIIRLFQERTPGENKHPSDTTEPADSGDTGTVGTESESQPPDTEPLPDYHAVNPVRGTVITPHISSATLTLGDELGSPYAVFLDAESGEIIAQKFISPSGSDTEDASDTEQAAENAADILHTRIYPASMTKLMTILVAYENCSSLDDTFRMTYEIIDPLYLSELALAGFLGGEDVTVRDLLYGAALPSGAEAAMGLALCTSGTEEDFVALMNDRARLLGMNGTHFTNCTGLHNAEHYSTLTDIAVLISFMEQDPTLAEILSTYQYTTSPTAQHPEGILLTSTVFSRMEGGEPGVCEIIGGKTGYTAEAQQCLAVYGIRRDTHHPFAAVFAGADTKWKPVYDAIYLYQFHTGAPPADTQESKEAPG